MIQDRIIVCIASAWDLDPTSKHHVMKLLAEKNNIVWVNYHGTRRPGIGSADLRSALSALRRFAGGIRRVSANMVQVTPLVLPGASHPALARLSQRMLARQIQRAVQTVDASARRPVQVWTFAPDVAELLGRFDEECFVYYCVDEYTQFEDLDRARIAASEDILMQEADVIVTTSESLYESRRVRRPDTVLVRHGVDYEHFARAWRSPPPEPKDVASIQGPVFGFFGLIHHWVDLDLIAQVARLRPGYSFVLLGDARVDTSPLRRLSNVRLLGRKPYAELPAYCARFDAAMLLFRRNAMTFNVNPIKLYEYLAAGLPVVSTTIPEVARVRGPVRLADTPEDFAAACDQALAAAAEQSREQISSLVVRETWASRVEVLSDLVMGHMQRRAAGLPKLRFVPAPQEQATLSAAG